MSQNNPQNQSQQEDIVDTIAQYDLDEDFPDYANEQNKELNQIVSHLTIKSKITKKPEWADIIGMALRSDAIHFLWLQGQAVFSIGLSLCFFIRIMIWQYG